jgi:chromodomain-helicase-DNA-binding protein 7
MICTGLQSRGPFLIVAPLSTIPHWQREFQGWTNLNTIIYHGSQDDRNVIREFEFAFECDRPQGGVGINQRFLKKCHNRKSTKAERIWMTQVVITTPEMLVTDDFNELTVVEWELLVVDEAHRLKSHTSKLAVNLRDDRFVFNHTLLLTGTPIQNNMNELWALMNVIDPNEFDDCESFMERYDNMQSKERVDELHDVIRPYMLRRLKEDVEKSVPPKEETLIEVELTVLQKQYYRALYEKNVQFLHRDVKRALDGPSLNNLSMQLRKCCNHPFLLKGVEEKAKQGQQFKTLKDEADFLAKASGKLVLLDKLLPKLQDGGHRVLIFSQFKIMLDIIEDYLSLREFKQERIDGSITGKKRQMAIDRFQSKSLSTAPFVMLLSTRAGGVGKWKAALSNDSLFSLFLTQPILLDYRH